MWPDLVLGLGAFPSSNIDLISHFNIDNPSSKQEIHGKSPKTADQRTP